MSLLLFKASQLGFTFTPRKDVQRPGVRGGRYFVTDAGKVRYGERPQPAAPRPVEDVAARAAARVIAATVDLSTPLAEPEVGVGGSAWLRANAARRVATTLAELEAMEADTSTPEERVSKLGNQWQVRTIGSASTFPVLFATRKEAVTRAEQNGSVAPEMARHRLEEALAIHAQHITYAQHAAETYPTPTPLAPPETSSASATRPDGWTPDPTGGWRRAGEWRRTEPPTDGTCTTCNGAGEMQSDRGPARCPNCHGSGREPGAPPIAEAPPPPPPAAPTIERWPSVAKTLEDTRAQPWELRLGDYQTRTLERRKRTLTGNIHYYREKVIPELGPKSQKRVQYEANVTWWQEQLDQLNAGDEDAVARVKNTATLEYTKLVKEAVSKGKPVPVPVIAQSLEFRTAMDARARYDKGHHTSFANISVAVDASMQARRGYKVKRQDGKPIGADQKAEIEKGIDEVEEVLGPLKDIFERANLTIAHTSGKFPFMMSDAGGLYSGGERRITIGVRDVLGRPIHALAHELGHFIDGEAGRALGKQTRVHHGTTSKTSVSLAEADSDSYGAANARLIERARATINSVREVQINSKKRMNATADLAEKAEIERQKVALGPYWRSPCEIWARLVEQTVANKLGRGGIAMDAPGQYARMPGWWTAEDFATLMPEVEAEIGRRLAIIRGTAPAVVKARTEDDRVAWWVRALRKAKALVGGRGQGAEPAAAARVSGDAEGDGSLPSTTDVPTRPADGNAPAIPETRESPTNKSVVSTLATRKAEIERDLFYLDDEDLPALEGKDDNASVIAKARLVTMRAELLGELLAVDAALVIAKGKQPNKPGSRGGYGHYRHGKWYYGDPPEGHGPGFSASRVRVDIRIPDGWRQLDTAALRRQAVATLSHFEATDTAAHHPHLGTIAFRKSGVRKLAFGFGRPATRDELLMVADLPRLLSLATLIRSEPPRNRTLESSTRAYHTLGATARLAPGASRQVKFVVREDAHGHMYYTHAVVAEIKKSASPPVSPAGGAPVRDRSYPPYNGLALSHSIAENIDERQDAWGASPEAVTGVGAREHQTAPSDNGLALSQMVARPLLFFKSAASASPPVLSPGLASADAGTQPTAGVALSSTVRRLLLFGKAAHRLHYRRDVDGVAISIENRQGSLRHWTDHDGTEGTTRLAHPYGYARMSRGLDGEHLDVLLGPQARTGDVEATTVYVVLTNKPPDFTEPDEQKACIGFKDLATARAAFLANYSDDARFIRQIDALPWSEFKRQAHASLHGAPFVAGEVVTDAVVQKARPLLFKAATPQATVRATTPSAQKKATEKPVEKPPNAADAKALGGHLASYAAPVEHALEQLATLFPGVPMAGRVKHTATLAEKAVEGNDAPVESGEDTASLRLVLDSSDDERLAAQRLARAFTVTGTKDYLERPLGLGYRGIDCVVTVEGRPVEVQLRTLRQIRWADAMHDAVYKHQGGALPPEIAAYLRAMADYYAKLDDGEDAGEAPEVPETAARHLGRALEAA